MGPPIAVVAARVQLAEDWMRSLGITEYVVVREARDLLGYDPSLIFFYDFDWAHSSHDESVIEALIFKAMFAYDLKERNKELNDECEELTAQLDEYRNRKPWWKIWE